MAGVCDRCRLFAPDDGPTACPGCGANLRPARLGPEPASPEEPLLGKSWAWLGLRPGLLVGAAGLTLGLTALNGGPGSGDGPSPRPHMAVIRPGMSADEVARLLAGDRRWVEAGGRPRVPADGEIAYDLPGARTTIVLSGGRVVQVEENDGPGSVLRTRTRAVARP